MGEVTGPADIEISVLIADKDGFEVFMRNRFVDCRTLSGEMVKSGRKDTQFARSQR